MSKSEMPSPRHKTLNNNAHLYDFILHSFSPVIVYSTDRSVGPRPPRMTEKILDHISYSGEGSSGQNLRMNIQTEGCLVINSKCLNFEISRRLAFCSTDM